MEKWINAALCGLDVCFVGTESTVHEKIPNFLMCG